MLLHPRTPRPSTGWGATKVDMGVVLPSPCTGIMEDRLRHSPLHQLVKVCCSHTQVQSQVLSLQRARIPPSSCSVTHHRYDTSFLGCWHASTSGVQSVQSECPAEWSPPTKVTVFADSCCAAWLASANKSRQVDLKCASVTQKYNSE